MLGLKDARFFAEYLVWFVDSDAPTASRVRAVVQLGRCGTPAHVHWLGSLREGPEAQIRDAADVARVRIAQRYGLVQGVALAIAEATTAGGLSEAMSGGGLSPSSPWTR